MFARPTKTKKQPQSRVEIVVQHPPADRCGFCGEGTPCLCASSSSSAQNDEVMDNTLPPLVMSSSWSYSSSKLPALHPAPWQEHGDSVISIPKSTAGDMY
jgi:hypothetical protein